MIATVACTVVGALLVFVAVRAVRSPDYGDRVLRWMTAHERARHPGMTDTPPQVARVGVAGVGVPGLVLFLVGAVGLLAGAASAIARDAQTHHYGIEYALVMLAAGILTAYVALKFWHAKNRFRYPGDYDIPAGHPDIHRFAWLSLGYFAALTACVMLMGYLIQTRWETQECTVAGAPRRPFP